MLLLALGARLARLGALFQDGEVVPLDGDSVRHLARMESAVADGFRVPAFDPWVNWPSGAFEPWAPGFDFVGALMMSPFAAGTTARLAASMLPVLLGLAVVGLTALVARRAGASPWSAWGAALLVAFGPQLVSSSLLGRTDHHVWEAASLLALAAWALTPTEARGWRFELVGAGLFFFCLWGFDGAPLYVALVSLALGARLVLEGHSPFRGAGAIALVGGALLTAAAYSPVMQAHGELLTFKRPSLLQPALVVLAAAAVGLAWVAARAKTIPLRAARLVGFGLGLVAVAALISPLRTQVLAGLEEWLAREDPWLATIAEFQPLWGADGLTQTLSSFGRGIVLAPVLFPLGAWALVRQRGAAGLQLAVLAVTTFALTCLQMRFGRVALPFTFITCVVALEVLLQRWSARAVWLPGLVCLVGVLVEPKTWTALVPSEPAGRKPIVELSQALRELAPEHGGRGVLANWEDGHFVEALGRHPVLVNGFGTYASPEGYELSRSFWTRSQADLETLFAQRRLGWWIDGGQNALQRKGVFVERDGKPVLEGKTVREFPLTASLFGGSGDVRRRVPHLEHFWPRAASSSATVDVGVKLPDLWLFEHVAGAVLEGTAAPGTVVSASLVIGETWPYSAWTTTDAAGTYALRLPIPSGFMGPGLKTSAAWQVRVGDQPSTVVVSEDAVRSGAVVKPY